MSGFGWFCLPPVMRMSIHTYSKDPLLVLSRNGHKLK